METDSSIIDYSFVNFIGSESLLNTSQYAKVIFLNVDEKYPVDQNLVCKYSLSDGFITTSGDRIVLFKLGWQHITEYILFEWAPTPIKNHALEVRFETENLPRNYKEFYQVCYISGSNAICGASVPFQFMEPLSSEAFVTNNFSSMPEYSMKALASENASIQSQNDVPESERIMHSVRDSHSDCMVEILRLKEENKLLKEGLLKTSGSFNHYDSQITDLQNEIKGMKMLLISTQNDVSDLKRRIGMAGEEYKKLYIEKVKSDRKCEKLLKKSQAKKSCESNVSDSSCDIGDLDPLPPLPILM